jgi:cbb3-type cytochrome oxidase maturation protein
MLSGVALLACIWAIKRGQFDDLETPQLRMLEPDSNENN